MFKTQSFNLVVAAMLAVALATAQDQGKFGPVGPGPATQRKGSTPSGPAPKMPDGKPDLSGVWTPTNFMNMGGQPALQPWADTLYKERRANLSKDDPEGNCLPAGVPRISPFPMKLVQTPALVVMLDEGNVHSYRQFFLDGRGHPKDLDSLWMGVPVVTQIGRTIVGRAGFSQLTNLQLPNFVAENDEQFIELGRRWSSDLSSLAEIRRTLRERMSASPVPT